MSNENSVSLGFIHSGTVRVEFMISALNVMTNPVIGNMSNSTAGPLIALARNNLVAQFLARGKEEWLWCVDTDIVFGPNTIDALLEAADPDKRPIMSAVYYTVMHGRKALAFYEDSPDVPDTYNSPIEFPDSEVVDVDGTGAGCLLVHRSVFHKIYEDNDNQQCWFREMVINDRVVGEDLSFSVRAKRSGFPIHINTGVMVGHVKAVMLGEVT